MATRKTGKSAKSQATQQMKRMAAAKAAVAAAQESILEAEEVAEEGVVEDAEEAAAAQIAAEQAAGVKSAALNPSDAEPLIKAEQEIAAPQDVSTASAGADSARHDDRANVISSGGSEDAPTYVISSGGSEATKVEKSSRSNERVISESSDAEASEQPKSKKRTSKKREFADLPPVLIVAAEAAPLAKTGGLADVVGALPKYLKKIGVDARIIMPFHSQIKHRYAAEAEHLFNYDAGPQWDSRFVGIDKLELDGTIYYFVDNETYFGGPIYTGDNFEGQQYAFFAQAVCDSLPNLDFDPGIIHCNDWHTALVPFKLKARYARMGMQPPATLLTIHNLAFQGTFGDDLAVRVIGDDERAYAWDLGVWNMMKAGIDTADRVNTVSPTYAWEITTPEFGEGLQDDLRSKADAGRLSGILNGIDTDTWNPAHDQFLPSHYTLKNMAGKRECKRALLQELGMQPDMDAPLIAMVGRLTPQKGIGLAAHIIGTLVHEGAMFVVLGSGDADLEWQMRQAEEMYKGRVCSYIGYNNDLSHRIYAASDFFLMPSAFEPCGISQMIAMRYGSLPIVHETGGLKDTVQPYNEFTGEGCGFSFSRFDGHDAVEACRRALSAYQDDAIMSQLIRNAMTRDFSFDRCARSYAELYRSMVQ